MNRRGFLRFLAGGTATVGLAGCMAGYGYDDASYGLGYGYGGSGYRIGYGVGYGSGWDDRYAYDYYPVQNIYYHRPSRYYYYNDRGRWRRSHYLPRGYKVDPGHRRRVHVHDGPPYYRNHEHRQGRYDDGRSRDQRRARRDNDDMPRRRGEAGENRRRAGQTAPQQPRRRHQANPRRNAPSRAQQPARQTRQAQHQAPARRNPGQGTVPRRIASEENRPLNPAIGVLQDGK